MILTINDAQRNRTIEIPDDTLWKPQETWDGELFRIVLPRMYQLDSLLISKKGAEKIGVFNVSIMTHDTVLNMYSAWITLEKENIAIEYDTYSYGKLEILNKVKGKDK